MLKLDLTRIPSLPRPRCGPSCCPLALRLLCPDTGTTLTLLQLLGVPLIYGQVSGRKLRVGAAQGRQQHVFAAVSCVGGLRHQRRLRQYTCWEPAQGLRLHRLLAPAPLWLSTLRTSCKRTCGGALNVRSSRLFLRVRLESEADTATLGSVADRHVRRRQLVHHCLHRRPHRRCSPPTGLVLLSWRSGLNFLACVGGRLALRVSVAEAPRSPVV